MSSSMSLSTESAYLSPTLSTFPSESTLFSPISSTFPTDSAIVSDTWEKAHYLSLTLWDIDREFQKSHEAYGKWLAKKQRKRMRWGRFGSKKLEDALGKTLGLGRQVRTALEKGIEAFGSKFEQGDSTCHAILSAQLLRVQHEIRVPLEDSALARISITIPKDELLTAAKGVRRACLQALRDQHSRLQQSSTSTPFLPPPRFSVNFCPFALELQKEGKKNDFQTSKVRRRDRHDEREICPHCSAHVSVSMHSGLPAYRHLLFQSHLWPARGNASKKATFACTGCYKTFEDSYGFLDHVFQKEIGSERSCQQRWSTAWHLNRVFVESDPVLVDKCLRNCLKRERTRSKALKSAEELGSARKRANTAAATIGRVTLKSCQNVKELECLSEDPTTLDFTKDVASPTRPTVDTPEEGTSPPPVPEKENSSPPPVPQKDVTCPLPVPEKDTILPPPAAEKDTQSAPAVPFKDPIKRKSGSWGSKRRSMVETSVLPYLSSQTLLCCSAMGSTTTISGTEKSPTNPPPVPRKDPQKDPILTKALPKPPVKKCLATTLPFISTQTLYTYSTLPR